MNKPNVLLFDIDNTLLDFSAGAMQAMEEIFRAAGLPYAPEMFAVFQVENDKLWARIERGELTIAGLRDVRWQTILARLGLEADGAAMEDAFRDRLHESAVPVAGAPEVLARLHGKYRLCAASNGPYAQQVNRLRRAGMLDAFERLFISGQMGAEKPSRVFFDRCLAQLPGVRPGGQPIGKALSADPQHLSACRQQRQRVPFPGRDARLVHPFAQLPVYPPPGRTEAVAGLTAAQPQNRTYRVYFSIICLIF